LHRYWHYPVDTVQLLPGSGCSSAFGGTPEQDPSEKVYWDFVIRALGDSAGCLACGIFKLVFQIC